MADCKDRYTYLFSARKSIVISRIYEPLTFLNYRSKFEIISRKGQRSDKSESSWNVYVYNNDISGKIFVANAVSNCSKVKTLNCINIRMASYTRINKKIIIMRGLPAGTI